MTDGDGDIRVKERQARKAERHLEEARRRKRLGVQNSQTDPERIVLRRELRSLIDQTKKAKGAITAGNRLLFANLHKEHDNLHKKVTQASEANLDVEELALLSVMTSENTKKMTETFTAISAEDYVSSIKSLFSLQMDLSDGDDHDDPTAIDWLMLGRHPLSCIIGVSTPDWVQNVMDVEIVEVKKKQSVRIAREVDTQVENVEALKSTEKLVKTQTENRVQLLLRILYGLQDEYPDGIPLMQLVVNPDSFSQSVENLFDLSFLIGSGHAAFVHDQLTDDILVHAAAAPDKQVNGKGENVPPIQSVITMTYDIWKESVEVHNIKEPIVPTRKHLAV